MTKKKASDIAGFGERLTAYRKAAGLTQKALSEQVGVSRRIIAYYERETRHPPTTILPRIAQALKVSTDDLLAATESRPVRECVSKTKLEQALNNIDCIGDTERRQLLRAIRPLLKDDMEHPSETQGVYPAIDGEKRVKRVREAYYKNDIRIIEGDSRHALSDFSDNTFQCCITSPPYWGLRDYGIDGQIGAESDPDIYIADLVRIFREVRRTLRDNGTLWLNIGDSYTSGDRRWRAPDKKNAGRAMSYRPPTPKGLKPKDLIGVPWRLALAMQADGWFLRSDIIWNKPNCQPESVKDRPTRAHEYVFLMTKTESYFYDFAAIMESTASGNGPRNRRTVWNIHTNGFHGSHFAVFPPELVRLCMEAGSKPGDMVLDPFFGSGTVGLVCREYHRQCVGIELNPEYVKMALDRTRVTAPVLPLYAVANSH